MTMPRSFCTVCKKPMWETCGICAECRDNAVERVMVHHTDIEDRERKQWFEDNGPGWKIQRGPLAKTKVLPDRFG